MASAHVPSSAEVSDIYQRYAHALYRRCFSLVQNKELALDLVQDSFARYWAARSSWRAEASPFTVLYRIATNVCIDWLRAHHPKMEELDPDALSHAGGADGPARVEDARNLAALTRGLPEEDLTVAVLYHVEGYTQDEVASSLDLSRRTVGSVLKRVALHVRKRASRMGYPARGKSLAGGQHG